MASRVELQTAPPPQARPQASVPPPQPKAEAAPAPVKTQQNAPQAPVRNTAPASVPAPEQAVEVRGKRVNTTA